VFMGGVVGKLLHEFAVTIIIAVFVSAIVSLTLTPMLCSRLIKAHSNEHGKRHNVFYRMSEEGFAAIQRGYESSLRWSLAHRKVIVAIFFLSILATVQLFRIMPQDFLPTEDTGRINASTEGANGVSFAEMRRHQELATQILDQDPNVASVGSSVGSGGIRAGLNSGNLNIALKPRGERTLTTDQVIAELRPKFAKIPGLNVIMQNRPPIRLGGYATRALYQYTMQDIDLDELYSSSGKLMQALQQSPMFADVNTDLQLSTPSINVGIDRDTAATLGVTANQIEVALGAASAACVYRRFIPRPISTGRSSNCCRNIRRRPRR